jgi:hypothetical protein
MYTDRVRNVTATGLVVAYNYTGELQPICPHPVKAGSNADGHNAMPLSVLLKSEVDALIVTTTPTTVLVVDPAICELAVDFTAVDTMSCSLSEMRLNVPSLATSGTDELQAWANALCQQVTYLLESIGTLEIDPTNKQVLIRSTPPQKQSNVTKFYEIILASQTGGHFTLRRYQATPGSAGRVPVDISITHEVLYRLVDDLVATIP